MVPQRQEPVVPLMHVTLQASRPGSKLKTSFFGDGSFGAPRQRGTRFKWSVRGQLFGRPLTHCQGSGGQVRAPCSIAVHGTDDLEPRVSVALPCDPELGRGDRFCQMQELGVATEVQKHADLPQLWFLGDLEDEPAVRRMAAHDGHEDHPSEEKFPSCSVKEAGAVHVG